MALEANELIDQTELRTRDDYLAELRWVRFPTHQISRECLDGRGVSPTMRQFEGRPGPVQ